MENFQLVYVGGIGRSGSTLVEVLLGRLPGVCAVGEVVHLWQRNLVDDELCGCGEAFSGCGFWRAVGEEAFGGWHRLDSGEVLALKGSVDRLRHAPALLRTRPPARLAELITRYTALYDRLYAAIARVSGCSVVVDASKHGSLAACLRHRYPERLRVVHIVRDPRAVAYSWGKQIPRPGATATSLEQTMARYSPGRASVQWIAENAMFSSLARRGVPTLRVRYEDLAAEPDKVFGEVAAFAGHRGAVPFGADPLPAGPARAAGSAGAGSAGVGSAGAESAGVGSAGAESAGVGSAGVGSAGVGSARVGSAGAGSAESAGVGSAGAGLAAESHALSGNPMRFATGPLTVRLDATWQRGLARRDRATVSLLTGASRRRYGY